MKTIHQIITPVLLATFIWSCAPTNTADLSASLPVQEDTVIAPVEDTIIMVEEKTLPYRPSRTRTMDLIHTKLEVSFDWNKQQLIGVATLELTPYYYPQSELELDAKGFEIKKVQLLGEAQTDLDYTYDEETLGIVLDRTYRKGEHFLVQIDYIAKPEELSVKYGEAIAEDRGLYFINADSSENKPKQIWTQGEPEANRCWFPTIDAPNERCTQEMYITVKEHYKTLSNGLLVYSRVNNDGTRTDYWKMDQPHAPYLFMMAIGDYAVVEDSWNDIEVSYYVEHEYENSARGIFGNTPEMMTYFSELLDYPFPWPKYSQVVVRDYVSGAMENTTASVFMEDLQIDNRELIDYNWDEIIAHELFHQWFGDLLTTESWANLTLNEAFANYSEYLWLEYKYGKDDADLHILNDLYTYLGEAEEKKVEVIRYYHDDPNDMFDSHTYSKGGAILHMLRNYVGDEAFFDALQLYVKTNAYKSVEIHDLRKSFEEITGEDLNWFFNQWFLAAGHPELEIRPVYDSGVLLVEVEQVQDLDQYPVFELPMLVDIWVNGEARRYSILINEPLHEFRFELEAEPDLILWDAEQQLVGTIQHEKSDEELAFQFRNAEKIRPRYEALEALMDSIHIPLNFDIAYEALGDSSWQIRQRAVDAFDEYVGANQAKVEAALVKMVKEDPKSLVKGDAITILGSMNRRDYADLFKEQLGDSSYVVLGSALFALAQSRYPGLDSLLNQFDSIDNINVVIPLAATYAGMGKTEKYPWFETKLTEMRDAGLYYMVNLFGQFLMYSSIDNKEKGSLLLGDIARGHRNSTIRLSAFQSLGLIDDLESVMSLKKEIVEKEEDEELKELFLQFM